MGTPRKSHSPAFKAKVAPEAIKQEKTVSQLSGQYGVHPNQIRIWKKKITEELPGVFSRRRRTEGRKQDEPVSELYRQIGRLKVEPDRLKKNLNRSGDQKKQMIEPDHPRISVHRQCELLSLPRSSYYYRGKGESSLNPELMHLIDEEYARHPFYGSRRLTARLRRQGYQINRKRVMRLMQQMGIETVYPKRSLSRAAEDFTPYPYLLRGLKINRPDQVRSSDITYIRMHRGFVYLTVVMDRHSRFVLSCL